MSYKKRITRDYGMLDYYKYLLKTTDINISKMKLMKEEYLYLIKQHLGSIH